MVWTADNRMMCNKLSILIYCNVVNPTIENNLVAVALGDTLHTYNTILTCLQVKHIVNHHKQ